MSKLNVDQKTIKDLFQDKRADFLIPDYQRPYAWGETECQTLWDDIFSFAIPDEGRTEFDSNSEYFLGPIVTFKNSVSKMEVIDGQQRLTTLMLLLRAFYEKFGHMQDKASVATKQNIEKCIWKTDEFGEPDMSALKIDSEVATDKDKDEFLEILKTGVVKPGQKSRYAANYRFFQNCIDDFFLEDGFKIIPFNEFFDTKVDGTLISKNTLNGQYITRFYLNPSDLDKTIDSDSHSAEYILGKCERKTGKTNQYRLGTIIKNGEYFLLAHYENNSPGLSPGLYCNNLRDWNTLL